jgi:hypothetical protein
VREAPAGTARGGWGSVEPRAMTAGQGRPVRSVSIEQPANLTQSAAEHCRRWRMKNHNQHLSVALVTSLRSMPAHDVRYSGHEVAHHTPRGLVQRHPHPNSISSAQKAARPQATQRVSRLGLPCWPTPSSGREDPVNAVRTGTCGSGHPTMRGGELVATVTPAPSAELPAQRSLPRRTVPSWAQRP